MELEIIKSLIENSPQVGTVLILIIITILFTIKNILTHIFKRFDTEKNEYSQIISEYKKTLQDFQKSYFETSKFLEKIADKLSSLEVNTEKTNTEIKNKLDKFLFIQNGKR